MPIQRIDKIVDGNEITIVQFSGSRGILIKARLVKLIMPAIGAAIDIKNPKAVASLLNQEVNLSNGFTKLAESLDPEQFLNLLLDLLAGVYIKGQSIDKKMFDDMFVGNYNLAYKYAFEVIKANNFFDFGDIGSKIASLLTQVSPEKSKNSSEQ